MFSNSSSYLGGGPGGRPGQPQYGQQTFINQQNQQQQNGFAPQPTGFQQAPLQQQYTGYPSQAPSQHPQYTGFPQQNQPAIQQQPQILSQKTGQTSSQIAASFSSSPAPPTLSSQASSNASKIPKIRLSFLTATDQAKFEQLFKSAVGDGQALDGEKVKDLLLRSKLPGGVLSQIWTLSDTTKSGQLLFPEFALAMYLCNLKLVGKDLPQTLPEKILNEVSSMVDIISFGVPDDRPPPMPRSNAPNFDVASQNTSAPPIQQPQPQASNSQLLNQIASQPTGFAAQYIPPQPTGFQSQAQGIVPQQTGFPNAQTGLQQNSQVTGYSGPRPPMPPMPTGFGSNLSPSQTGGPTMPLNAQPTGRPGQWGLVNAPASGLPNIEALQHRMMPQPGREGGFSTQGLSGNATVPWAVTKDEKKIYDQLFRAWDGLNKGFIGGDVALEVMGQSGLPKNDLERIWTLADAGDKGRLDLDEFAVAMHLIYRKLNGYPVPNKLPPELVPPSSRHLADSIGTVKSLLSRDAEARKNTGAFLQPQKTGVSYLKSHSFRTESNGVAPNRKDATVFRNNDEEVGYKSSARRRVGDGGRTPSPAQSSTPSPRLSNDDLSADQLRKKIREKQVLLDAIDFKEETAAEEDDALDRKDRREADDLYQRIRRLQDDIDAHPNASLPGGDSEADRRNLKRQLQRLTDRMPELASLVRRTERNIADAQLELFRLKDARQYPGSAGSIAGTGPGGVVTESDRLKARAKAMMQQRSAALRGEKVAAVDDGGSATRRLEEEQSRTRREKGDNERMIKDVEESVGDFSRSLENSLASSGGGASNEHEKRRWEEGLGVEDEVRDFIFDLQRSSRAAKVRNENRGRTSRDSQRRDDSRDRTPTGRDARSVVTESARPPVSTSSTGSYSSYKTAEDRAAFIKQQAEQRMAERLAALGLKPAAKSGESAQQRQEREERERQTRLRQAEEEDAKREEERQQRLKAEQPTPPNVKATDKKPPPPPSRKARADSGSQAKLNVEDEAIKARAEQKGKEQAIRDQQAAQEVETKAMENSARQQEDDLSREKEAAAARLRALEEQVKLGKIKKQEEKRRKQAAEKEAKEREAKLNEQRAELDAAKDRERQLQLQLESLGDEDDSSDEEQQENTPTSSQILPRDVGSSQASETAIEPPSASSRSMASPPTVPPAEAPAQPLPASLPQSSSQSSESKNPFFKHLNQQPAATSSPPITSPPAAEPPKEANSTNPFFRMTQPQQQPQSAPSTSAPTQIQTQSLPPPTSTTPRPSRRRQESDDEWSAFESSNDGDDDASSSDDEGPERPGAGGSAKHLASILFGTMAPPRPLSAMDEKKGEDLGSPKTPQQAAPMAIPPPSAAPQETLSSPPPAPPMPGGNAPPPPPMPGSSAPPPPPPPMPNSSAPPPPPMPGGAAPPPPPMPNSSAPRAPPTGGLPDRAGLLGDIQKGKGLRKVETKDRSTASTAGRVL